MWHAVLHDSKFYELLFGLDQDVAEEARLGRCPHCGGVLHRGDYQRKPRGGPAVGTDRKVRFSFCCSLDGCRRRQTPPSLRFLARKVYWGVVVLLVSVMRHGATPGRRAKLCEAFGMCPRTLDRWRAWWQGEFAASAFWKRARGAFAGVVDVARLPLSLVERFVPEDLETRALAALRFLQPVTSGVGLAGAR